MGKGKKKKSNFQMRLIIGAVSSLVLLVIIGVSILMYLSSRPLEDLQATETTIAVNTTAAKTTEAATTEKLTESSADKTEADKTEADSSQEQTIKETEEITTAEETTPEETTAVETTPAPTKAPAEGMGNTPAPDYIPSEIIGKSALLITERSITKAPETTADDETDSDEETETVKETEAVKETVVFSSVEKARIQYVKSNGGDTSFTLYNSAANSIHVLLYIETDTVTHLFETDVDGGKNKDLAITGVGAGTYHVSCIYYDGATLNAFPHTGPAMLKLAELSSSIGNERQVNVWIKDRTMAEFGALITAVRCKFDLYWTGNAPTLDEISRLSNILHYNGEDSRAYRFSHLPYSGTLTTEGYLIVNKELYKSRTHYLPVIYITTSSAAGSVTKESYVACTVSVEANGVTGFTDVSSVGANLKGRGHFTWLNYPKKTLKLKFDEKIALYGDEKDKDWVLTGNYGDRSLTRTAISCNLAKSMEYIEYTMDSYPVDVFWNGQYWGTYDLIEQIEVAGGRVEISTDEAATDCGFLLEIGGDGAYQIYPGIIKNIDIHYPKTPREDQKNYISNYISTVSNLIVSGADISELGQYVDIDNFVDWILVMEFVYNTDSGFNRNVYMYKEPGGKLKFGPVWDFDFSVGAIWNTDATFQNWALCNNVLLGDTWATYLYQNPSFMAKMKARWAEKKDAMLANVNATLDTMLPILDASYRENYYRWMLPVEGQPVKYDFYEEYSAKSLEEDYNFLRKIINYRYKFLNSKLG